MANLVVVIFSGITKSLAQAAYARLSDAWAPSTYRSYTAIFRLYLAFMIFTGIDTSKVNIEHILAFFECLKWNGVKANQMQNYLAAIRSCYVRFSLNAHIFDTPQISMFIKAVQKTAVMQVRMPNLVDKVLLKEIVQNCRYTYMGDIFKTVYLLGFFGFLRLSNLVPHTASAFSHLKHLCKGDFFFNEKEAIILLKWTKTLQFHNQARLLRVPLLQNELCPAIKKCLKIVPGDSNAPIFQFKLHQNWQPLTDVRVRKHLKNVLQMAGKSPDFVTFHSFRRSGASMAFSHNVPLQEIQRHGTWTSDCVWRYVTDSADCGSKVASTFAFLFA